MRDIVIVPSFYRPEYLALCLEAIANAQGGSEKEVWVGQDIHNNDQVWMQRDLPLVKQVVEQFAGKFRTILYVERPSHHYIGNPCNFLELYKAAYATDARYVYLIEDDVHIGPDFFQWHEAVQARGDYWITVGWHCIRNPEVLPGTDATAYIETTRDYSSIGICWQREKLEPIVRHARPEYYRAMAPYLAQNFPGNPIPPGQWTEQAGLIMRTLLAAKDTLTIAWPVVARCAHVGISGYHRPQGFKFEGNLDQRVAALRKAKQSTTHLVSLSKDPFDDVQSLPVCDPWTADQLHVVQRFKWNGKL